ncbi:T9SS type A sorting domain-containing protein [Saccharicrinis aurantiacus]|uniref:T9SS type A sorting domain-containing protein n=1 Tax=Saccharicrinis aurantiacus TaxID=1849719 RepID=UPI0009500E2A|nr:T9SS type A sorting domain-containing protein [Saccharicrinis aurantiacus]
MKKRNFVLMALGLLISMSMWSQKEADFYKSPVNMGVYKNLVKDYQANVTDKNDDSEVLQRAIDEVSALSNGGRIFLPAGKYFLANVNLKSNVHLKVSPDAIIYPTERSDDKNYFILGLGDDDKVVENVSIIGREGSFKVDLRVANNKNVTPFRLKNVDNFRLENIIVKDDITKFSAIALSLAEYNGKYFSPRNGVLKNARITNAHYGYGLVQAQVGSNILFTNLSGEGGVTLRLESGYSKLNLLQVEGLFDIYGRDISCTNGNAALMISPHAQKNGYVNIEGVKAVSCGFAVRIGQGYTRTAEEELGIKPGWFDSKSIVKTVKATYGTEAQLKSKHFKYMPCDLRNLIAEDISPDGESYQGPSIAAVINASVGNGEGYYNMSVEDVTSIGFKEQDKDVLLDTDVYDCLKSANAISPDLQSELAEDFKVYPNPANEIVNVQLGKYAESVTSVLIRSSDGKIVTKQAVNLTETVSLNISDLETGIYFIEAGTCVKKLVVQ